MTQYLFSPLIPSRQSCIMIRVGTKCANNCTNCKVSSDMPYENTFLPIYSLQDVLTRVSELFAPEFLIKFYGTDAFHHTELTSIVEVTKQFQFSGLILQGSLEYIAPGGGEAFQRISASFGVYPILHLYKTMKYFDINTIDVLVQYYSEYVGESIVFVGLDGLHNHMSLIQDILHVYKQHGISYDKGKKELSFRIKNFSFTFGNRLPTKIQHATKEIANLPYTTCALNENLELRDSHIHIKDEIEVDLSGNVFFHYNEFCYDSRKNICNIFHDNSESIFKKMSLNKEFLREKSRKEARFACYDCITQSK